MFACENYDHNIGNTNPLLDFTIEAPLKTQQTSIEDSFPNETCLVGIETETARYILVTRKPLYKGDIVAMTVNRNANYPLLAVTVESLSGRPVMELVSGPVPIEEQQYLQKAIKLFKYVLSSFYIPHGQTKLRNIIAVYNSLLSAKGLQRYHMTYTYDDTLLKKNGVVNEEIFASSFYFEKVNDDDDEIYLTSYRHSGWAPQISFNVPYTNFIYLDLLYYFFKIRNEEQLKCISTGLWKDVIKSLFSTDSETSKALQFVQIVEELIDKEMFSKLIEQQKYYLYAFFMRIFVNYDGYHNMFLGAKRGNLRELTMHHLRFSPRINLYQELFEIWNDDIIQIFEAVFKKYNNDAEAIATVFLKKIFREIKHDDSENGWRFPPKANSENFPCNYKDCAFFTVANSLKGTFQDLLEALEYRKKYGKIKVHGTASPTPFIILPDGKQETLPENAKQATAKGYEALHYRFYIAINVTNEIPYCVLELRNHNCAHDFIEQLQPDREPDDLLLFYLAAFWGDNAEKRIADLYQRESLTEKTKNFNSFLRDYKQMFDQMIHQNPH